MSSQDLTFSDKGIDLLKGIENLRLTPYDDQTGKDIYDYCLGATIGFGHLIHSSEWDTYSAGITQDQADSIFISDIAPTVSGVNRLLQVVLAQNEFDALVILAFNIGLTNLGSSSLLKLINEVPGSNYATVQQAWMAFSYSEGKQNTGLLNRRNAEYNIYNTGVYKAW